MNIEERMNAFYDHFTENDCYICECILNHQDHCANLSIEAFSCEYHVSMSALSRFAQKLGLPGYSELKSILRMERKAKVIIGHKSERLIECYQQGIDDLMKRSNEVLFENMDQAGRIVVFGDGYLQERVAKEMKRMFLPSGKLFYDVYGYDMMEALYRFVKKEDVVFLLSLKGESKEMLDFAKRLKLKGAYVVSITRMKSNPLSRICHESLYIRSIQLMVDEEQDYEIITPYFILIELLYVQYKMHQENVHKLSKIESLCE